jgi:hypothetical protein
LWGQHGGVRKIDSFRKNDKSGMNLRQIVGKVSR